MQREKQKTTEETTDATAEDDSYKIFESENVKHFYENHSELFSKTRHKVWPKTKDFLSQNFELILDAGTGNGRSVPNRHTIALDQCHNLLGHNPCHTKIESNILCLPFKSNTFDAVLSIAVIHHLATKERRTQALKEMLRVLQPGGKCLVYVWNKESINNKKFKKINGNDYFVKWGQLEDERYYYMYTLEELCEDLKVSGFVILESGKEQESLYAILTKTT